MRKYGKTITDSYQEVLEWTVTAHELQEKKKVSKREIDKLEDGNEHGMVALKLAQSFGTPKEIKTVQDINKRHNRAGSIEHKDQKERDAIIRKYYDMAEKVELDEMNPTDHVKKKGDKYCVYNADGSVAKEFDNEEDANKYAIDNHDKLMAEVYEIGTKEYADHTKNMTPGQTVDEKYDLYHKSFSDAMKHAVDYAKSKMGIAVDPKEIDDKVATGPKKPSDGKTNKYRLKGKGGTLQIQVYNKGGSKPFELNMYKEEIELDEDAMIVDLDYSKNPKGLYNAVLQMSKKLGLTIYNAPQAMKDLQTKGKVRLGGKGANLVKFMKHLNDKGIEPSVDVQKGKMQEKKLTDAEMKKREEIAKAIEKDDPDMPMDKKMAIATATAKKVAEEEEPDKPDTAKQVDQMRDDKKKTRIAQLQLQIAKATETINKLNTQEK
tara:strand:- start:10463 stop:11764 length:1302 start_codon:yes stop_codon:yes gene_type:complete